MTYFKKRENQTGSVILVRLELYYVSYTSTQKYMSSALSMANLFELATKKKRVLKNQILLLFLVMTMEMMQQTSIMMRPMIFG